MRFLLFLASVGCVHGSSESGRTTSGEITLDDGTRLKNARIVSMGASTVSIVHEGGVATIPKEIVPLDTLARAHLELGAKEGDRKAKSGALIAAQLDRDEEAKSKREEEILLRKAMANAREGRQGSSAPAERSIPRLEQQLITLKAKFPKSEREAVGIVKSRSRGDSSISGTAETRTSRDTFGNSQSTTVFRNSRNRQTVPDDTIEVEVPSPNLYSEYQGWVRIATLQSLPKVIERIEEKIEKDLGELGRQGQSISNQSGSAQANKSITWIQTKLRPYLAELKKFAAENRQ